jgi:hypothetical protein
MGGKKENPADVPHAGSNPFCRRHFYDMFANLRGTTPRGN